MTFDCSGRNTLAPYLEGAERDHDDISERAINRVLTSTQYRQAPSSAPPRPKAIFRIVPVVEAFAYTRVITGADHLGVAALPVQSALFATERAAYELAKRAAARFQAEHPTFLVGLVGIDLDPETRAPKRQLRDEINERRIEARRKRQRERYARVIATPEARERLNAKARKWPQADAAPKLCDDGQDIVAPTCMWCSKPTGFRYGRPLKFCVREAGEKYSRCNMRYTNSLYAKAVASDPEINKKRNERQRELRAADPDRACEARRRFRQKQREDPVRWAAKLAAGRRYKARRRAILNADRPPDRPTGSVLLTSAPNAPGRELLASVYAEVSQRLPPYMRMEIISEATLLHLEGADLKSAVAQAKKNVNKGASLLRYAKPIDDCFWLADETALIPGASS